MPEKIIKSYFIFSTIAFFKKILYNKYMEISETKINLPVFETLGLVMAYHTLASKEDGSIVFNEDLMLLQTMLNKNLMQKFGDKVKNMNFEIVTTFEDGSDEKNRAKDLPYGELIKSSILFPNKQNGLPPVDYVRTFYEYNARTKLDKVEGGAFTNLILDAVSAKIALFNYNKPEDYEKSKYMYWCGDAKLDEEYFKETGKYRYLDKFSNHAKEAYDIGIKTVCDKIASCTSCDYEKVKEVVLKTLNSFEKLQFLQNNLNCISAMRNFEELRTLSENSKLDEQKRENCKNRYESMLQAMYNYILSEKNK